VLSVDYNLERLYRREQGEPEPQPEHPSGATALVARAYAIVYAPQDRLVERLVERRLRGASPTTRAAYHDELTLTVLANFGLSTQLAVLGICLAAGSAVAYLWVAIACAAGLVPVLLYREWAVGRVRSRG
jgi:hypothetical protein